MTWTDPFAPMASRTQDLHVRECNLRKRKTDQNFRLWPPRRRRTRPSATRLPPAMEGQPPDDLDAPAMDVPLAQDVAEGAMGSALGALAAPIPSLAAPDAMAIWIARIIPTAGHCDRPSEVSAAHRSSSVNTVQSSCLPGTAAAAACLPACQGGEHPGVRMSTYQQPWHGSRTYQRQSTEQHGSRTYERHGKTSGGQKVH